MTNRIGWSMENQIFVFGSNLAGRHGRGAALFARNHYGAVYGVGEGLTGKAYAIPTKDNQLKTRTLKEIEESISTFVCFAGANPDKMFLVTPIGTGLAGYTKRDIAEIFYGLKLTKNVFFTKEWFE